MVEMDHMEENGKYELKNGTVTRCFGCQQQVTPNTLKVAPNKDQFLMPPVGNVFKSAAKCI